MKYGFPGILLPFLLCLSLSSHGQSLETLLERYAGENASGYVEPLITAFGSSLNSGLFYRARVEKGGLHINIRLNGMLARFSEKQRRYSATTESFFTPSQEVTTATIIGDPQGAVLTGSGGSVYVFPGGYNLSTLPLVVPTVTVGNVMGTELVGRYFSTEVFQEIGTIMLAGVGIRHSLSQYFNSPVDIAIGGAYHTFKVGDIFKNELYTIQLTVGKSFSFIDIYAGGGYESNVADVKYSFTATDEPRTIELRVRGKNRLRALAGINMNLLIFHLNLDYNWGHQQIINVGFSLGL